MNIGKPPKIMAALWVWFFKSIRGGFLWKQSFFFFLQSLLKKSQLQVIFKLANILLGMP